MISSALATAFQCVPVAAAWDKTIPARCTNTSAFWLAYCIINIVTDLAILALPVREVMQLHQPLRERIALLTVFSLGALSVISYTRLFLSLTNVFISVTVCSVIRATAVAESTHNTSDITCKFHLTPWYHIRTSRSKGASN